jgi:hypothetical protein
MTLVALNLFRHPSESWGLKPNAMPPETPAFAGVTIKGGRVV